MAVIITEPSRTFSEFLLMPGYTDENCKPENVSLKTPLTKFKRGEELNSPKASSREAFLLAIGEFYCPASRNCPFFL